MESKGGKTTTAATVEQSQQLASSLLPPLASFFRLLFFPTEVSDVRFPEKGRRKNSREPVFSSARRCFPSDPSPHRRLLQQRKRETCGKTSEAIPGTRQGRKKRRVASFNAGPVYSSTYVHTYVYVLPWRESLSLSSYVPFAKPETTQKVTVPPPRGSYRTWCASHCQSRELG